MSRVLAEWGSLCCVAVSFEVMQERERARRVGRLRNSTSTESGALADLDLATEANRGNLCKSSTERDIGKLCVYYYNRSEGRREQSREGTEASDEVGGDYLPVARTPWSVGRGGEEEVGERETRHGQFLCSAQAQLEITHSCRDPAAC